MHGVGRGRVVAVVLTLAIGVALLTTTFAIVRAALWRELPFPDAARLAIVFLQRNPANEAPRRERWSFARAERLKTVQHSFDAMATYSPASLTLSAAGLNAELVYGERVSAQYLPMLGVTPLGGRLFGEADDDPARPSAVAIVTERLWTRLVGNGDTAFRPEHVVRLNGVSLTIVGVVPSSFRGLSDRAEIWIPRTVSPQITYAEYLTTNQNFIPVVGRLRSGIGWDQAQAELDLIGATINRALPSDPVHPDERVTALAVPLRTARIDPTTGRSLPVLLAAVALLHLLACANVANLLLARAAARRQDYAVRLAPGSGPGRLFAAVPLEGGPIALAGGCLGVLPAWWATGSQRCPEILGAAHSESSRRLMSRPSHGSTPASALRSQSARHSWSPWRRRSLHTGSTWRTASAGPNGPPPVEQCPCGGRPCEACSSRSKWRSPHCLSSARACCGTAISGCSARTSASIPITCSRSG